MKNLPVMLTMLTLLWVPCVCHASPTGPSYHLPDPVATEYNSIHYTVLPQVELISIVQAISEYPRTFGFLMQPDSFRYKEEVLKYFEPFRDHPVVKWFNETCMQPRKMNFSLVSLYDHVGYGLVETRKTDPTSHPEHVGYVWGPSGNDWRIIT